MENYLEKLDEINVAFDKIIIDAKIDLEDAKITNKDGIKGKILSVTSVVISAFKDFPSIKGTLVFENEDGKTHDYYLNLALSCGSITFDDEKNLEVFNKYYEEIKVLFEERKKVMAEYTREEREREAKEKPEKERLAAIEKAEKERLVAIEKAKIKAEKRKTLQIAAAKNLQKHSKHHINNEYYYALGWLARHARNFIAAMPDYLEPWFIRQFGDFPHRAVDQTKLSPSGLPSQYALYFKIDLDTNDNLPPYFRNHLGDVNKDIKPISDTQFIFDIMANEGFVFGRAKYQDLDKVLDNIPEEFLEDFHAGYAIE